MTPSWLNLNASEYSDINCGQHQAPCCHTQSQSLLSQSLHHRSPHKANQLGRVIRMHYQTMEFLQQCTWPLPGSILSRSSENSTINIPAFLTPKSCSQLFALLLSIPSWTPSWLNAAEYSDIKVDSIKNHAVTHTVTFAAQSLHHRFPRKANQAAPAVGILHDFCWIFLSNLCVKKVLPASPRPRLLLLGAWWDENELEWVAENWKKILKTCVSVCVCKERQLWRMFLTNAKQLFVVLKSWHDTWRVYWSVVWKSYVQSFRLAASCASWVFSGASTCQSCWTCRWDGRLGLCRTTCNTRGFKLSNPSDLAFGHLILPLTSPRWTYDRFLRWAEKSQFKPRWPCESAKWSYLEML